MQPIAHRAVEALGRAKALDGISKPLKSFAGKAIPNGFLKDLLSGTWLGHPLHPMLTDVPIGTWTAAGFYDCQDAALDRARECYRSGEEPVIDVRLPDGCGWTFMAIVNTFDVSLGVNAAVANNIGGQIDGQVHFYKTPPVGSVAPAARRPAQSPRPASRW